MANANLYPQTYTLILTVPDLLAKDKKAGLMTSVWEGEESPVFYGEDELKIQFNFSGESMQLNFAVIRFKRSNKAESRNPVSGLEGDGLTMLDITSQSLVIRKGYLDLPPEQMSWGFSIYANFSDANGQTFQLQLPDPEMVIKTGNPPPPPQ